AELAKAMGWLEQFIEGPEFALGDSLTLADCELVPVLFFFDAIGPLFGEAQPFTGFPRCEAYSRTVQKQPAAAKVVAELDEALKRMMGSCEITSLRVWARLFQRRLKRQISRSPHREALWAG